MNTGFLGPAVATVPTVYGIETSYCFFNSAFSSSVATVPTVYGIETPLMYLLYFYNVSQVATVPTVYGIET